MAQGLGGFFDAYNTMASNRRADETQRLEQEKREQEKIKWAMENQIANQAWENNQELRGLGRTISAGKQEEFDVPNTAAVQNFDRNVELSANGADFLGAAQKRTQDNTDSLASRGLAEGVPESEGYQPPKSQQVPMPSLRNAAEPLVQGAQPPAQTAVGPLAASIAQRPPETVKEKTTVPYSPVEQADMFAKALLKQGNVKGAMEAATGILDITEAAAKHNLQIMGIGLGTLQRIVSAVNPKTGEPFTPEEAKAIAIQDAQQKGLGPEYIKMLQSPMTSVAPNGTIVQHQADGSTITNILQSDGTVKIAYEKPASKTGSQKIMTPEFTETNGIGNKKFETTHQWQFHDTGTYSAPQLFQEWKRLGGTDEAAKQIAAKYGGVEKIKKENQSYATPASVINFDRKTTLVGTDKDGQPINQSPDGHRTVQLPDGTTKPYYGPVYAKSEASAMSTEGGGVTGELTPAQKVANKKAAANPQAIALKAASTMYDSESPEIKRLRVEAQKEGFLPTTKFKDLEAADQWINSRTGGPSTILLKKKVKFLADSLQKAIGGNAGGEWAFKVASDILDPSYDPASFNSIVDSHGASLRTMANERIQPYKAAPKATSAPKARPGYKIQSRVVNGKTEYREVPK